MITNALLRFYDSEHSCNKCLCYFMNGINPVTFKKINTEQTDDHHRLILTLNTSIRHSAPVFQKTIYQ